VIRSRDAWVFDVDGCLIDSMTGTSLRPLAREVIDVLHLHGVSVVLWSAGGGPYARRRARQLGFESDVLACYGKEHRDESGRWKVDHIHAAHRPLLFIDDQPDELPAHVAVVGVRPYLAASSHDRGLADLLVLASSR
jgi:long-chain acyl-CoA synthetase